MSTWIYVDKRKYQSSFDNTSYSNVIKKISNKILKIYFNLIVIIFKFNELKSPNEIILPPIGPIKPPVLSDKQLAERRLLVKDFLMKNWTHNGFDLNKKSHEPKYTPIYESHLFITYFFYFYHK